MGWVTSQGTGLYRASETHRFWSDRLYQADGSTRAVIWCHGAGGNYLIGPHEANFALNGVPIMATNLGGGQTWGNDASMEAIDDAWDYAKDTFGAKDDKMVLWGGSMGSLTAMLYALDNPENVAAVGVVLPIMDPEQVRLEDAGGYASDIEAVHGSNPVPDTHRPSERAADLEVPAAMWISSTDSVGDAAVAEEFADTANVPRYSMGAIGHSYLAMNNAQPLAFIQEYL